MPVIEKKTSNSRLLVFESISQSPELLLFLSYFSLSCGFYCNKSNIITKIITIPMHAYELCHFLSVDWNVCFLNDAEMICPSICRWSVCNERLNFKRKTIKKTLEIDRVINKIWKIYSSYTCATTTNNTAHALQC